MRRPVGEIPDPLLATAWVCCVNNVCRATPPMASRCACSALSFPVHGAYIGFGSVVVGVYVRDTTANCSSAAYWVGQFVVGCRSVFRLVSLVHRLIPPIGVCSPPRNTSESSLTGAAHFVFDALPVWLRGFACLHEEARQLSRGCMDDGLAFSPPGLPVRRWVTSGCVKSGSQWLCVTAMSQI